MGLFDFLKNKKEPEIDPLHDLTLSRLQIGFMLDYDMKTWQVTARYEYDFGDGDVSREWELSHGREKLYLERAEDDEVEWSLCRKIPVAKIEGDVRKYIIDNDDPPEQVVLDGRTYYLDESGAGQMRSDSLERAQEFVYWDFIDEEDAHFLSIEQWGETEFEASVGDYVEEYQFSNILPGELKKD
jgi:hypothetical protein